MQFEEARWASLREERRDCYAELAANITDIMGRMPFSHENYLQNDQLVRDTARSLAKVELIGSQAVRQIANQVTVMALRGLMDSTEDPEKAPISMSKIRDSSYTLQRVMASDLGISSISSAEEVRNFIELANQLNIIRGNQERSKRETPTVGSSNGKADTYRAPSSD
jgi:hypothetical protein